MVSEQKSAIYVVLKMKELVEYFWSNFSDFFQYHVYSKLWQNHLNKYLRLVFHNSVHIVKYWKNKSKDRWWKWTLCIYWLRINWKWGLYLYLKIAHWVNSWFMFKSSNVSTCFNKMVLSEYSSNALLYWIESNCQMSYDQSNNGFLSRHIQVLLIYINLIVLSLVLRMTMN